MLCQKLIQNFLIALAITRWKQETPFTIRKQAQKLVFWQTHEFEYV